MNSKQLTVLLIAVVLFFAARTGLPTEAPNAYNVALKSNNLTTSQRVILSVGLPLLTWEVRDYGICKVAKSGDLTVVGCPDGRWYRW